MLRQYVARDFPTELLPLPRKQNAPRMQIGRRGPRLVFARRGLRAIGPSNEKIRRGHELPEGGRP
jgi:hypothetical protein